MANDGVHVCVAGCVRGRTGNPENRKLVEDGECSDSCWTKADMNNQTRFWNISGLGDTLFRQKELVALSQGIVN